MMQITESILCIRNKKVKWEKKKKKKTGRETGMFWRGEWRLREVLLLFTYLAYKSDLSGIAHLVTKRYTQTPNMATAPQATSAKRDCKLGNSMKQRCWSVSVSSFVGPKCRLIRSSFFLAVHGSFGCSACACRFSELEISASPLVASVAVWVSPNCEDAKLSSASFFFQRDSPAFQQCALRGLFPVSYTHLTLPTIRRV